MKIILDAMGGDLAPEAPVLGAIDAAKDFGAEITLVGRSEEILEVMRKNGYNDLPKGVEIAGADDVVDMHDDPGTVIHKRKNSSMVIGLRLLAAGRCLRVCRLYRRAAHRRDSDRQAGEGHPSGRHGSCHAQ